MKRIIILFLLFYLSLYSQEWWNREWKYRKKVVFDFPEGEKEKTGVVVFKGLSNGKDIRVINSKGEEIKYFLLKCGKGNEYEISFPLTEKEYYIYYGNRKADEKKYNWRPEAGLILEVYKFKGNNVNNWRQAEVELNKSKKYLLGRKFVGRVWDSLNPFGSERKIIKVYTGYFFSKKGQYTFATSSDGPSFILIDDKVVASWPGWHWAVPYVTPKQTGTVHLENGLHKFQYIHFCRWWRIVSVASIKNKEKFIVIPESFFIPVYYGRIEKTEKFGKKITADFSWENTYYLYREKWALITYRFTDTSFSNSEIIERRWDFGDGQKGNGKEISHTYINPGFYNVTLYVKNKEGQEDKITMKIYVDQDYSKINIPAKNHSEYLNELKRYNYETLPFKTLFALSQIYLSYDQIEEAEKCFYLLKEKAPENRYIIGKTLIDILIKEGKEKEAEKIYFELIKEFPDKKNLFLDVIELQIEMAKLQEAENNIKKILNGDYPEKMKSKAEILLGDIYRRKGEGEKARNLYAKFTDLENFKIKNASYAQQVLYYIKAKDFSTAEEKLNKWAEELPLTKLDGLWSVLRCRLFYLKKKYRKALEEAEIFLKVCEKNNLYKPFILYLEAKICEKTGEKVKSQHLFKEIEKNYPNFEFEL